ncbi:potassium transporter 2-like [Papaver somniferum]|uniref:potassium transporter 2-like n=1 Tax=Papaver somniferum TaxID=3469 RepID=UPI000E703CDC|nr:potassium transporter 2-like [Papaver somniferum]
MEETMEPASVSVGVETVESMTDVIEMEQTGLQRRVGFAIDNESERDERFETDVQLRGELEDLLAAQQADSAFILGHSYMKVKQGSSIFKRAAIDVGYDFMSKNSMGPDVVLRVPPVSTLEVGIVCIV